MVTRVLAIEDNPANLSLIQYLLTAFHYDIVSLESGERAVEVARQSKPDLILCDIQLGALDGYDVLKMIRDDPETARIPVVALTAFAMVGDKERAMKAGFDGYVTKPIEPSTFVETIQGFLRQENRKESGSPKTRTIVALDDNDTNLVLLKALFDKHDFRVLATHTSDEAFALIKRERPDLVITDVMMPDSNGYEFVKRVKADHSVRDIPLVFISSTFTTERDRQFGLSLGAAKYLFRPIEPQQLLAEVLSCLPSGA